MTVQRDLAGLALALGGEQLIACIGRAGETEHQHRHGGFGLLHRLAALIEHRSHATEFLTGDDRVAESQRALLDDHRGDRTATLLHARFDDVAGGKTIERRGEFEHFGLQQDRIEQLIDALAGERRDIDEHVLSAPLLRDHFLLGKFLTHPVRIRRRLVHFVDCHHDRHACRTRVLDRLEGLRHDAIVRRDHQHHHIGGASAACAHRREGRVAGRVEEGHTAPWRLHMVGADMLGDTACLA